MTLVLMGGFLKELRLPTSRSLENIFEEDEPAPPLRRQNAMVGRSLSEVTMCVGYSVECGIGLRAS